MPEIFYGCDPGSKDVSATLFIRSPGKVIPLPDGYDYRFIAGNECILGIAPDKKPILVTLDGVITEIEF